MTKQYFFMILAMIISLFIYVFYRTEDTIVNELMLVIIPKEQFKALQYIVSSKIQLHEILIFSLPEGLWMFTITVASSNYWIRVGTKFIHLIYLPIFLSVGLEFFQLFHITNGRFDFWDIGFSVFFWLLGASVFSKRVEKHFLFSPFNMRSLVCLLSYSVMYLAHVDY